MDKHSRITNDILYSFFNCKYKAWLKVQGEVRSNKSDFEILQNEQNAYIRSHIINKISSKTDNILTNTENINSCILKHKHDFIFNGLITTNNFVLNLFALEKISGASNFGKYLYVPIITTANETIIKSDRLMLAFFGACLEFLQGNKPDFGRIIYGSKFKSTKVNLTPLYLEIEKIFLQLVRFQKSEESLNRILNKHCIICEFEEKCRDEAIEKDHLSLLTGISEKEIYKLNNKGIFTVNQLSYTFRPRRKRKKTNKRKRRSYALKALSIRENKIHVYETPLLPTSDTKIFLDMEGLPGSGFCYLIGLVIIHNGKTFEHSFWADTKNDEITIFLKLLERIDQFKNYTLYHYGNYEIKNLKRVKKKLNIANKKRIDKIIRFCCNLLSFMYSNIYLPTYSNSLKDIGNYIGFKWTDKKSTGIQSVVWRKRWESTGLMRYKNTLIKYNREDCYALFKVYNLIKMIITNDNNPISAEDTDEAMIIHVDNIKKSSPFKFWNKDFALEEFDMINKYSYFDYQRERVHIREHKLPKKKKATIPTRAKNPHRINKTIDLYSKNCIKCKKYNLDKKRQISRKVIDLKFTNGGVKRWIVRYRAHYYSCNNCKIKFLPTKYKNIKSKYAHNLICWSIFQYIENNQGFIKIEYNFYEIFKLNVPKTMIHEFKRYFMEYYDYTYTKIKKRILCSEVIYIDETPLKMKYDSGYAWVLTTSEEVIFFYKPTREGDFLKKYLKDFKGVLVSDFFPAYDSLVCIQQKCLIHLIRDFNDDLLKNPFDNEFKEIAIKFTNVIQNIVKTIDRYKLRKCYLNKHKKEVDHFLVEIIKKNFKSEIACYYQRRFKKNKDKMFQFLNHDNVSWNNTNAEHAIKKLSIHRNDNIKFFESSRIDEYLKIMSIYVTCHYKNISFLKFLLSGVKNIDKYCEKYIH